VHLKLNFQTPLRQEFMLLLLSAAPGSALERRQAESEGGQDVQVSRRCQPAREFSCVCVGEERDGEVMQLKRGAVASDGTWFAVVFVFVFESAHASLNERVGGHHCSLCVFITAVIHLFTCVFPSL